MRIQCRQNAPEHMMRVTSKSYSFCLSFQWGFHLQRAYAAYACRFGGVSRKIDAYRIPFEPFEGYSICHFF